LTLPEQPVAQRRHHYDAAFEHHLRSLRVPYVAVDEAKRAVTPTQPPGSLKSFDFVVYSASGANLLIDVKGRKHSGKTGKSLQNWVTADDVDGLVKWTGIFGSGFDGAFAFLYWCESAPPDALFQDFFEFGPRWYAVLTMKLADYRDHMRPRSPKWGTVCVPAKVFHELARPLKDLL
jgi:hypothetical protein